MDDLISREQLINKLNSTRANITFNLPVEEILGDKVIEFGKELYNKGIDDFLNEILSRSESARPVGWLGKQEIVTIPVAIEIAERLKIV